MHLLFPNILAILSAQSVTRLRLVSMLAVLVGGLVAGYLARNKFGLPEHWAKKIMTAVLVSFNWLIALLIIWRLRLTGQFIWLPIAGVALMLSITALSAGLFSFLNLDRRSRLTLILAGGLSNLGYTGGALVCYALFGITALGLAQMYLVFWLPIAYLVFFPLLKLHELRVKGSGAKLNLRQILDPRCLVIPAVVAALILNLSNVRQPGFIVKFHIIDIFVYIASSLSFFAIGLRVNLSRLKSYTNLCLPLCMVKFILTPAVAVLFIWLLLLTGQELTGLVQKVIIVLSATPSAVLMVTMSNVFDLDGPLASALWVVTTAVFVTVVVPVLFFVFV